MPAKAKPWTVERLERACRAALANRTRIRGEALPVGYDADVQGAGSGGPLSVRHDLHKTGLIDTAVHETLHDVLGDTLSPVFDDDVEESIIAVLEARLCSRIKNSRRRLDWWRAATNDKTILRPRT